MAVLSQGTLLSLTRIPNSQKLKDNVCLELLHFRVIIMEKQITNPTTDYREFPKYTLHLCL